MICETCGKQFSSTSNAVRHQKKFHPEAFNSDATVNEHDRVCKYCRTRVKSEKSLRWHVKAVHKNRLLKCNNCEMKFVLKKDIIYHIKRKHSELTTDCVHICNECGSQYSYKRNLWQHKKIVHEKNYVKKEKYIECPTCGKKFTSSKFLNFHLRKVHKQEVKLNNEPVNTFVCADCGKKLSTKHTLINHIRIFHQQPFRKPVQRRNPLICPECNFLCYDKSEIYEHFQAEHECAIEYMSVKFETEQEFYNWKAETERKIKCTFINRYTKTCKDNRTVYFVCNRSGFYNPSGKGKREIRHIGSKKINGFCPAEIQLIYDTDGISIRYQHVHVGHSSQLLYMNLSKELKNAIIKRVSQGVSVQKILCDLKQPLPENKDECDKVHMLTAKDIYNIATRAGVWPRGGTRCSTRKKNKIEIDAWVELNKENVLYYKKRNEIDRQNEHALKKNDFFLVIMTTMGLEMLRNCEKSCIVFDSTFNTGSYEFEVTSLMIFTAPDKCHPCCFLISNRIDEAILILFLSYISDRVPKLKAETLIANKAKMFLDSWHYVCPPPGNLFYSSWHVLHDWKNNLNKLQIKDIPAEEMLKLKTQIYKFLKYDLLLEKNKTKFHDSLNSLFLENSVLKEFQLYFEEKYASVYSSWAHCYRVDAGINHNIVIETFHKVLMYNVFRRRVVNQLSDVLNCVTQFLHREQLEKFIDGQVENIAMRLKTLQSRHAQSLQGKSDLIEKYQDGWIVPSFTNAVSVCELHLVERTGVADCECKIQCNDCRACLHSYTCTCADYLLKMNMCKHIHLICTYLNEFVEEEDVVEIDLNVEETIVNEIYEIKVEKEGIDEKENDKNVKNQDDFQKELIRERATERISKIIEVYINTERDATLLLNDLNVLETSYQSCTSRIE